jgi:aspartate aminotransferase
MPRSATLAIRDRCTALREAGTRVFDFGLGQSPFPVPAPVVEALRAHAHEKAYLPVSGLPALRAAVAEHLALRQSIPFAPGDIIVGPGSKELLFLLQVVHDGALIIPTPGWVSYEPQARILGRQPLLLPTARLDGYVLDPEYLDAWLERNGSSSRILVLNYPNNPTGATFDAAHLRAIGGVARKHRLVVLSDEIYGPLQFDGKHRSIATEYPEGTIVATGLSKWCGAGGWRLGVMAFPPGLRRVRETMLAVASETFTSTSAPIQYAAVTAFAGGAAIDDYVAACRNVLADLLRAAGSRLRDAGLDVPAPSGGFYLYPDFGRFAAALRRRAIATSGDLAAALLQEAGVAALPGEVFGRPATELSLRLSLVDFDGAAALDALAAGGASSVLRVCEPVLAGLDAITSWTRNIGRGTA